MKQYLLLQYNMISRKFSDMGTNPVIGFVLVGVGLVLISEFIFYKTEFAKYLILLFAFSLFVKIAEKNRADFLKIAFGDRTALHIRMVENILICIPFSILLLVHLAFIESLLLVVESVVFARFSVKTAYNFSFPTPFYKKPFEFTVGFRNTFYLFPLAYSLSVVAISVDNLNLGLFSLLLIFLIVLTYYVKPENEYFVWNHSVSPFNFLFDKLMTVTKFTVALALPIVLILFVFYTSDIGIILLFLLIGITFLWTIILAKYAAYPNEMNLPEGIPIAFCIYFPPLMLLLIPYFYSKSLKKLNGILK